MRGLFVGGDMAILFYRDQRRTIRPCGFGNTIPGFGNHISGLGSAIPKVRINVRWFGNTISGFVNNIPGFGNTIPKLGNNIRTGILRLETE